MPTPIIQSPPVPPLDSAHAASATALTPSLNPQDAFNHLWSQALRKCMESTTHYASQWKALSPLMVDCVNAEDVCVVLDNVMKAFVRFRADDTLWGKLRNKYLKPVAEVLLMFSDAIAETAAYFVCHASLCRDTVLTTYFSSPMCPEGKASSLHSASSFRYVSFVALHTTD